MAERLNYQCKFEKYKEVGMKKGFRFIASSPLVRSSYKAVEALEA